MASTKHIFRLLGKPVFIAQNQEQEWEVSAEEAHHARKVLRLKENDVVEVFDGLGASIRGCIKKFNGENITVMGDPLPFDAAPSVTLGIAIGALKPATADELISPLVELGVDEIHFFMQQQASRDRFSPHVQGRWQRIVLAAAKQSKRARLPLVKAWGSLSDLTHGVSHYPNRFILSPDSSLSLHETFFGKKIAASTFLVVGGEGGYSPGEVENAESSGFTRVKLGTCYIARAYTAAIAAVSMVPR